MVGWTYHKLRQVIFISETSPKSSPHLSPEGSCYLLSLMCRACRHNRLFISYTTTASLLTVLKSVNDGLVLTAAHGSSSLYEQLSDKTLLSSTILAACRSDSHGANVPIQTPVGLILSNAQVRLHSAAEAGQPSWRGLEHICKNFVAALQQLRLTHCLPTSQLMCHLN